MYVSIFQDIKTAATGEHFVTTFSERSLGTALWYHYRLALIVAAIFTLAAGMFVIPAALQFSVSDFVADYYPDDLVITIDNGIVSSNVTEPYALPTNGSDAYTIANNTPVGSNKKSLTHALVIDTTVNEPLAAMEQYDTFALLTRNQVLVRDDEEIRVFKLTDVTFTVSEEKVLSLAQMLRPALYVLIFITALLFPFMMAAGLLISSLFIALFFAFVVLLIGRTHDLPLNYKKAYVLTLYLLTLPLLFTLLGNFIPYDGWVRFFLFIALAVAFIRPTPPGNELDTGSNSAENAPLSITSSNPT